MNIGRVHTPPVFIARVIDPSRGGVGAHDDYWKRAHPCNIHCEGYNRGT